MSEEERVKSREEALGVVTVTLSSGRLVRYNPTALELMWAPMGNDAGTPLCPLTVDEYAEMLPHLPSLTYEQALANRAG